MPKFPSYATQTGQWDRGPQPSIADLWLPVTTSGRLRRTGNEASRDSQGEPLRLRRFLTPGSLVPVPPLVVPLTSLPEGGADGFMPSLGLVWFCQVARLAARCWVGGNAVPVLNRLENPEHVSPTWIPLLDDPDLRGEVQALVRTMPLELRAHALRPPHPEPVDDWQTSVEVLTAFVDWLPRIRPGRTGSAKRPLLPRRDWFRAGSQKEVWREIARALQTAPRDRLWSKGPVAAVGDRIHLWSGPARHSLEPIFAQLVLRLDPPAYLDPAADDAAATLEGAPPAGVALALHPTGGPHDWVIHLSIRASDGPDGVLSVSRILAGDEGEAAQRMGWDAEQLRGWCTEELKRIAPFLPPLRTALAVDPLPEDVLVRSADVSRLLRDWAPKLEERGIALDLPDWLRETAERLKLFLVRPKVQRPGLGHLGMNALTDLSAVVRAGERVLSPAEVKTLLAHGEGLVPMGQTLVEVDRQDLRLLARLLEAWHRSGGPEGLRLLDALTLVSEAEGYGALAEGEDAAAPAATREVSDYLGDLVASVRQGRPALDSLDPAPIQTAPIEAWLRPYQKEGVRWLHSLTRRGLGALLADDMGLGKTLQTIALFEARKAAGWLGPIDRARLPRPGEPQASDTNRAEPSRLPVLLACPTSVLTNWQRELARFAPGLVCHVHHGAGRGRTSDDLASAASQADVIVTSYALLWRDHEALAAMPWDTVVLDEAQAVKNPDTRASRAARTLDTRCRVALTGTPVENRLEDLWSIFHFLNPGYLGSRSAFQHAFAQPVQVEHDRSRANVLHHLVAPFILRRVKSDPTVVRDLPPKVEVPENCTLTREQARLYQSVVRTLQIELARAQGMRRRAVIAVAMLRLKQILNHPAQYLREDGPFAPERSGKVARILELVEEALSEGDRLLLFTQFTAFGTGLGPLLTRLCGTAVPFLRGSTARQARDAMIERFQGGDGSPILLLSLRAGGLGLNLTRANRVIHMDRWWNPAVEQQATDRAYRIGQSERVMVHKMVTVGTLEEHIDVMLSEKRELAETVVGGRGEAWLTELPDRALFELLTLRQEALEG